MSDFRPLWGVPPNSAKEKNLLFRSKNSIFCLFYAFLALLGKNFPEKLSGLSVKGGGHNGRKSLILAPQEIPDISGYQWGFGCQFVKAYITENPVTNQKIL